VIKNDELSSRHISVNPLNRHSAQFELLNERERSAANTLRQLRSSFSLVPDFKAGHNSVKNVAHIKNIMGSFHIHSSSQKSSIKSTNFDTFAEAD